MAKRKNRCSSLTNYFIDIELGDLHTSVTVCTAKERKKERN
jgi:hypothetical protein